MLTFLRTAQRWHPAGIGAGLADDRIRSLLRLGLMLSTLLALAFFLARGPLILCVVIVVGTIGSVLILLRPVVALYALAFAVPFGSLVQLRLGTVNVGASDLLVAGLVVSWLMRLMALRDDRSRLLPLRRGVALALLAYLGTLLISLLPVQEMVSALTELAKWVEFLLVFLFVAGETDHRNWRALVVALLLAGACEGVLGIYQFIYRVGPPGFVWLGGYMRAYGTFEQPNPFGGYLGLLLPLAYATMLAGWREVWGSLHKGVWWPAMQWLLALLTGFIMFAALVMSWSRGALVGVVGGAILVALGLGRKVWIVLLIGALVLALLGTNVLVLLPAGMIERAMDAFRYVGIRDLAAVEITDENFAVIERVAHWDAAWRMFSMRPWLGVGTGQYAIIYPSVALPRWQDPLGHAHNYILNVLAEGGLLGAAAYGAFMLAALVAAWRASRRESGWRKGLALGALGMMGHLLVHSLFDNLYVHSIYLLVAMLLGMVTALSSTPPLRTRPDPSAGRFL